MRIDLVISRIFLGSAGGSLMFNMFYQRAARRCGSVYPCHTYLFRFQCVYPCLVFCRYTFVFTEVGSDAINDFLYFFLLDLVISAL